MASILTRATLTSSLATTNPRIIPITIDTGTNRKLIVILGNDGADRPTSASFSGSVCQPYMNNIGAGNLIQAGYWMDIPNSWPTGSYDFIVSSSANTDNFAVQSWVVGETESGAPTYVIVSGSNAVEQQLTTISSTNTGDAILLVYMNTSSGSDTATPTSEQIVVGSLSTSNVFTSGRFSRADAIGDLSEWVSVVWNITSTSGGKIATQTVVKTKRYTSFGQLNQGVGTPLKVTPDTTQGKQITLRPF